MRNEMYNLSYIEQNHPEYDIKEILKVFNLKEMSQKVGPKFDLNKSSYREKVLNLVRKKDGNIRDEIISAIKTYTPELP